jgi:5-formyltetrahydrofolate cyclo-ligase
MKKQIRTYALKRRNIIPPLEQIESSSKIISNLTNSDLWKNTKSVMLYMSVGSEVFTLPLLSKAIEENKKIILPKVKGKHIIPIEVDEKFKLISGFGGILEPEAEEIYTGIIELCILPLVAFDSQGYRLGYGGGYYDRFLKEYESKIKFKIGLAYEKQRLEEIPTEEHDVTLDAICTEKGITLFRK